MRCGLLLCVSFALAPVGCGGAAEVPVVPLPSGPDLVVAEDAPPPPGSRRLGDLTAVHGHGCGLLGEGGTYAGALELLRNEAHRKAADYVQITQTRVPYSDGNCLHNEYVISGVAYALPKTEAKLDSLGESADVTSPLAVSEPSPESSESVGPSEPDWKNFAFPASHFFPKPFRLLDGHHRWDSKQIDPKRNLWGEGEEHRVISLVQARVTDVDGDEVPEAWILLTYGDGEGEPASGVPRPPTAVFVFRLIEGTPEPIGTVVSKEGQLSLHEGSVVQGDANGDPGMLTVWTLADGRLHAEIGGTPPDAGGTTLAN